ncbi:MAG: DNA-packaging protein [Bauldia sp.]|nr:DNA-packaging protein [Bauldia sp.]
MPAGRPPKFRTPEEMEPLVDSYFAECDTAEPARPYTIPGLAQALGFVDRQSLLDYAEKPEFSCTIKAAKLRVETQRSEKLVAGVGNVTGMIFDLKNNFGWRDKTEHELSSDPSRPLVTRIEIVAAGEHGKD